MACTPLDTGCPQSFQRLHFPDLGSHQAGSAGAVAPTRALLPHQSRCCHLSREAVNPATCGSEWEPRRSFPEQDGGQLGAPAVRWCRWARTSQRPHVLVSKCLRARLVWAGQRAPCALHSSSPGGDPQATCNSPGGGLRPTSAPPGSAWHVPSLLWASAAPTVRRAAGLHGGLALLWPGTLGGAGARLQRGVGIKRLDPRVLGRKLAMEDGAGQAWGRGAGWAWRRAQWTAGRPCVPEWTTGLAA